MQNWACGFDSPHRHRVLKTFTQLREGVTCGPGASRGAKRARYDIRRVQQLRHARLRRRGFSEEFIARFRGPAGLDIGAWTPRDTAVSILAEIIGMRTGRSGRPVTNIRSTIHA